MTDPVPERPLRRGWTTGTCAAAATRAAFEALVTGAFPDPVAVLLPGGERPAFALARTERAQDSATAGIIKDAGDDPDVTHGALVLATVAVGPAGSGITFRAGPGVGTVTRPGLPLPPGEPAINPVPREMIRLALAEARALIGGPADVVVTISIPGGEILAAKTLNGRLGIVGGLSILGTTGIVVPFSCAAWIHAIHRGVDVARADGQPHLLAATGATSEATGRALHGLPEIALIEMGDFAGGVLKYIRTHPVPKLTLAGGFAKMTKLGQGLLDLHSKAGRVDRDWLAAGLAELDAPGAMIDAARAANTAKQVLDDASRAGLPLGDLVAAKAWTTAAAALDGAEVALEILVVDRAGVLTGRAGFAKSH